MAWEELRGTGISYFPSVLESRRFAISIGRITVHDQEPFGEAAQTRLRKLILNTRHDVLIVRYPARETGWGGVLAVADRFALVPAGALAYWEVPAVDLSGSSGQLEGRLSVTSARHLMTRSHAKAREVVEVVVRNSFLGYKNHYSANPLLDRKAALDGYVEWALGTLERDAGNVLFLLDRAAPVGVATLKQATDGTSLEILLAGLVSGVQGQGWYTELLAGVGREAQGRGCARVLISSQSHNVRVQRAWVRAGLEPFAAIETVHMIQRERFAARALPPYPAFTAPLDP